MNILHCVSSLQTGGAEKLVKNLSIAQQCSNKVSVLSFGLPSDAFQPLIEKENIKVENIRGNIFKRMMHSLAIIKQFDVIHIHSPAVIRTFILVFPFIYLMKFLGKRKKIIYTIHGEVAPNLSGMKISHKMALFFIDETFAVSEKTRLKAESLFLWPKERIKVIKNGVNVASACTHEFSKDKLILGTVSRLIPLKKIEDLIHCIFKYKLQEHVVVKIFGDGPEKLKLELLLKKYSLEKSILFMGNVVEEDYIYPQIDCLVICSETEGLPMVLLEGMGYGIPCISTNVGAIPNIINESNAGLLFDVSDIEQLASHIKLLSAQHDTLKEKGNNGKQYVVNNYSIEVVANTYQKYYITM